MSIRCAVCGSKNVVTETKKEGYNLKKGAIGTVLFGMFGALAGTDGKETIYYHCADCGQVMNKPMSSWKSDTIDMYMQDPQRWASYLKEEKETYKNIEWDDNTKVSIKNGKKIDEIFSNLLKEDILKGEIFVFHATFCDVPCTITEAIEIAKEKGIELGYDFAMSKCDIKDLTPHYKELVQRGLLNIETKNKRNYHSIGDLDKYNIN